MGRAATGKHKASTKFVLLFVGLVGLFLIADLLWASSFSSSSNWILQKSNNFVVPEPVHIDWGKLKAPNKETPKKDKKEKKHVSGRVLSATFADLPAPEVKWEKMASAPVPRLDGAAIQIKNLLYVFAGYGTIDYVHSHVHIYNFTDNTWGGMFSC